MIKLQILFRQFCCFSSSLFLGELYFEMFTVTTVPEFGTSSQFNPFDMFTNYFTQMHFNTFHLYLLPISLFQ